MRGWLVHNLFLWRQRSIYTILRILITKSYPGPRLFHFWPRKWKMLGQEWLRSVHYFPHYWWWRSVLSISICRRHVNRGTNYWQLYMFFMAVQSHLKTQRLMTFENLANNIALEEKNNNCYLILMRWEVLLNIIRASAVLKNLLVLSRCLPMSV